RACFFFQAEDGIRDFHVTGVQTCALPIWRVVGTASTPSRENRACWEGPASPEIEIVQSIKTARSPMPLSLSRRAARTVQSEIRAMSVACEKVQGINLAQGVCDTEVPEPVREGAKQAMDRGINSYTRAEGLAPIRQAI